MLIKRQIFLALIVNPYLFLESLLRILADLYIFLIKSLSLFVDLRQFFFYLDHQLLVSNDHKISEKDELIVIVEDICNVLCRFFLDHFLFDLASELIEVSLQKFVGLFTDFDLLLSIFVGYELSEELFE